MKDDIDRYIKIRQSNMNLFDKQIYLSENDYNDTMENIEDIITMLLDNKEVEA